VAWFILKIVVLALLLLLSGFFSGSETALIRIGKIKARSLLNQGVKGADTIQKLVSEPEVLVTTVLIGNNLVNIAASALATSIAIEYFGDLGVGIAIGVMTFLILTFGEIVPKTLAMHHAERISLAVSKPLELMIYVIRPVARVFAVVSQVIGRLFGLKAEGKGRLSEEEVQSLLDIGEEDGAIEEDEKEMMNGVLKLDYITVKNVMTPREEMIGIEVTQSMEDARQLIRRYGYSRIPIFAGTMDTIVGILYAKDLLIPLDERAKSVKAVMKPAHFVRDTARVDNLLKEFREGKFHIAIVINAAGKTTGLICLEDLLEEIVGSIYDEYDVRKKPLRKNTEPERQDQRAV